MRSYGDLDLNNNMLAQFAIQAESNFPAVPTAGRVVFKDKRLYFCAEVVAGVPAWIPITTEIDTYVHTVHSSVPATQWMVQHNLNTTNPLVQIYDTTQQMVIPSSISPIDNNMIQITFGWPMAGRAVIMMGNEREGVARPASVYEHNQTTPSTSWSLEHNLGYNPVVRVFIGSSEVLPDTITHPTIFTTVITFSTPQQGTARCA